MTTEKYSSRKNLLRNKPFFRRARQSGLTAVLGLSLLGAGCESGGGSSTTTLYEARTGNEVKIENSLLDNTGEYSISQYQDALMYTDVAGENKGQVLLDNQETAINYQSSSSSGSSSTPYIVPGSSDSSSDSSSDGSSDGSSDSSSDDGDSGNSEDDEQEWGSGTGGSGFQ